MPFFTSKSVRPTYVAQGVNFDGITILTGTTNTPFTGAVASGKALISFWFRMLGRDGAGQALFENAALTGLRIFRQGDNLWLVEGTTAASANCFSVNSTTSFVAGSGWHHLIAARDTSGTPVLYIDGVVDTASAASGANTIDYAAASTMTIGARASLAVPVAADIADLYIGYGQYLDLTNPANLAKFISIAGRPVYLGTDGSAPTGTAPVGFFSGTVATWYVNQGTGGNLFTLGAGSLTASTSNP